MKHLAIGITEDFGAGDGMIRPGRGICLQEDAGVETSMRTLVPQSR